MTVKWLAILTLALAVAPVIRAQQAADPAGLLAAVHDGDRQHVADALAHGADVNARDDAGATALMHAAAEAPPEVLQLLLKAGADPNLADRGGSTALMWATYEATRVRLLLDAGASPSAERPDGMTPFITAALRGKADIMRMLVAAGADARRGAVMAPYRMEMPAIAVTTNDPSLSEFVEPSELTAEKLRSWTPPPMTQWLLTWGYSWRPQPADTHVQSLRRLLDAGADPNETVSQLALRAPLLSRVIRLADPELVRVLLDRGANPNTAGSRGLTPLMMAAAVEHGDAAVRMLLDHGAAIAARDEHGQTALDWALRLGETESTRLLRRAGATTGVPPPAPPSAVARPRPARAAVELAIERLQPAGPAFRQKNGCISCHQQSLPAIAVALAAAKGARTDRALASHPTQATLDVWSRRRDQMLLGNCAVFGFLGNVTYGLFGLAEEGVAPGPVTDAVTSCLSGLQKADGSWEGGDARPPLATGPDPVVYTALALRGLKVYAAPGRRGDAESRVTRALEFIRHSNPDDNQDDAFKLLGLVWGGASRSEIAKQADRVRARQRPDGGWSQLSTMTPDAYATGQALYALRLSGATPRDAAYRRGVDYLLRTQLPDGTWYVRSRAIGFQPYVDTGFPHGPDQFISSAATSWAVIALSHVL